MKIKKIMLLLLVAIIMGTTFVRATDVEVEEGPDENIIQPRTVVEDDSQIQDEIDNEIMPISEVYPENYEMLDNDYYKCDRSVELSDKNITGNIFVVAEKVKLSNVRAVGSVFIVAQSVDLTEVYLEGSCYIVAEKIEAKDTDCKNIYSVSKKLNLLEGTILQKNLYAVAEKCTYNAIVNNEVNACMNQLNIESKAVVGSDLNIVAPSKPEIPESAIIRNLNFKLLDSNDKASVKKSDAVDCVVKVITYVVSTVIITFIILKAMKTFSEKAQNITANNLIKNALLGLLFVVLVPILAILLMVTVVGARLGIIVLLIYSLAFFIATPISCIIISSMIAKSQNKLENKNIIINSAIVSLVVAILQIIPIISTIVTIVLGLVGFGTILVLPFSKENEE